MKVCGQLVKPSRLATGQILLVFLTFCVALQRPFRPHHGALTKTMMCLKCDVAVDLQKQKEMNAIIQKLEITHSLIILDKASKEKVEKSARNIPNVKVTDVNHFSSYDIIKFKKVVFTESSVKELEKRYS